MPYLLNEKTAGVCAHGAEARAMAGNPRVKVNGSPVLTLTPPLHLSVSECPNTLGPLPFPCLVGVFAEGAQRVRVMKQPVLLSSGAVQNFPTGASTRITPPQTRVKGL